MDPKLQALAFLAERLEPADLVQAVKLIAGSAAVTGDDPPAFPGQPMPGGKLRPIPNDPDAALAADSARYGISADRVESFGRRYPAASRIRGVYGRI